MPSLFNLFKPKPPRSRRSSSPSVRSPLIYYRGQSESKPKSQPIKTEPLLFRIKKFIKKTTIRLALIGSFGLLIFSWILNPKPVLKADNLSYHSAVDYTVFAQQQFKSLTNRNKITLNQVAIKTAIMHRFPEVDEVIINLPLYSRTPSVSLKISTPSFYLSGADTASQTATFVVANNGRAIDLANNLLRVSGLPHIKDQSSLPVKTGERVLGQGTSSFIIAIINQAKQAKVPIDSFNLPAASEEIDLKTSDKPYIVKFFVGGDPALQTGRWLAARSQFEQSHITPSEYLDVRVNGRIYYK